MPLEFGDPDEDPDALGARPRFRSEAPRGPWWRPASKLGRIFLGSCALLVLGGFTAAGLALRIYLERDARFRIAGTQEIQATGLAEVTRAQLLPVFGSDIGRNIFFVPLNERRKQIEQLPWVEHATVMRLLPNQIRVSLVERQPVAFTRHGQAIGLVDSDGVLLSMTPAAMARHHYSFPVITGIDPADRPAARKARMAVYLRLMADLDSTGHHYSQQISEIDLTDPEDARVILPEQGRDILAHFGEDHFLERYQRYKAHIAEWRQQYPQLSAVDLRYDQQVVLQMASGNQTQQPDAKPQPGEAMTVRHAAGRQEAETRQAETRQTEARRAEIGQTRQAAESRLKVAAARKRRIAEERRRAEAHRAAVRRRAVLRLQQERRSARMRAASGVAQGG